MEHVDRPRKRPKAEEEEEDSADMDWDAQAGDWDSEDVDPDADEAAMHPESDGRVRPIREGSDPVAVLEQGGSLYDVLAVPSSVDAAGLRRAYLLAARKYHPDRHAAAADGSPAEEAVRLRMTENFQAVTLAHETLSDAEKRRVYDECGAVDGVPDLAGGLWEKYFRARFARVREEDVESFTRTYRGSSEERGDVLNAYVTRDGDIFAVIDDVLVASVDDIDRFRAIIDAALRAGAAKRVAGYVPLAEMDSAARTEYDGRLRRARRRAEREASEAVEASSMANLAVMLHARQQQREQHFDSLVSRLEAKYGGGDKKVKKSKGHRK